MIRKAGKKDFEGVFSMARKLWPDVKRSDLNKPKFTYYIAEEGGEPVAFIMLAVRRDYVDGSVTSPVGYVEGIYVEKGFRKKNIGRQLVNAAEDWCSEKGFTELGSDVEYRNKVSQKFHAHAGFAKSDLVVHYIKKVRPNKSGRTS